MMAKEMKSLRQYAAEARGENANACPRCGCTGPHLVVNTYYAFGGKRRRMQCRNPQCNYGPIMSLEYVVPKGHHVEIVPDSATNGNPAER